MLPRAVARGSVIAGRALSRTARPQIASVSQRLAPATSSITQTRSYHEKVIDHYERPRNVGSLPKNDAHVSSALVGAPACGDVMKLDIRVDPSTQTITEAKFKTFGCGSAIASSSYLTELVQGMTLEEAARVRNTDIASELCLPPVKLHCSMLAEDAIRGAISNYYTKNPQNMATNLAGTAAAVPKAEMVHAATV